MLHSWQLVQVFDGIKWHSIIKDTFLCKKKSDQAKEQLLNASLAFVESSRGSQGTNSAGVFNLCQIRPYRQVLRRVHPDGIVGFSSC